MKGKLLFLFLCTIFDVGQAYCQNMQANFKPALWINSPFSFTKKQNSRSFSIPQPQVNKKNVVYSMLVSPEFYCNNLSFFCRKEIKFEKVTKIPFRFRLGSVQYVDFLEGKKQ